jgi:hypothetical protein
LKNKTQKYLIIVLLLIFIPFITLLLTKSWNKHNLANPQETKPLVLSQLNFLEDELKKHNLGERMQGWFPEGFVFINSLYGLTWCELAIKHPLDRSEKEKAFLEANYAYQEINSPYGKDPFYQYLDPEYGAFYVGWKTYLQGKILTFHHMSPQDSLDFFSACNQIAKALNGKDIPYLTSYPGAAWPADVFLCVAALKTHDKIFVPKYTAVIDRWINMLKTLVDPKTGLIPHSVTAGDGAIEEGARGSSISLMLRLLFEIDKSFAQDQFELYQEHFLIERLGVPAIREYPKGTFGLGDIDSGPVIWSVGFAGTIVAIGVFNVFDDQVIASKISVAMELYGLSFSRAGKRRYLFGLMPMADAFIAWSRASTSGKKISSSR